MARVEAEAAGQASQQRLLLYRRILAGSSTLAQLWFEARVLDRYRTAAGYKLVRTDTVGQLRGPQWTLDFGIAFGIAGEGEALIHLGAGDILERLPESERDHWAAHAAGIPLSRNFVLMQLSRGACIDDGDVRPW